MGYEETLKNVPLFSGLAKPDLARLAKVVVPRSYGKGDAIIKEGEQAVAFYVIVKGKVDIEKGEEKINSLGAGDMFGDMALLDGHPRATSVVASEDDTECLVMTRWDFTAELNINPSIALAMLPVLSKRIRQLEADIN